VHVHTFSRVLSCDLSEKGEWDLRTVAVVKPAGGTTIMFLVAHDSPCSNWLDSLGVSVSSSKHS
jgi:hypothetical protein